MAKEELCKQDLRIKKYESAKKAELEVIKDLEKIESLINFVRIREQEDSCEKILFFRNEETYNDLYTQWRNDLAQDFNLVQSSLGRFIFSYITEEENIKYFAYDIRLSLLEFIRDELKKVLNKIDEYKQWILNCDESELKHQIRRRKEHESFDEPTLYLEYPESNIDEGVITKEITNRDYIDFLIRNNQPKKLMEYLDKNIDNIDDKEWLYQKHEF